VTAAGDRFRAALRPWAIPAPIRAAAAEDPFAFPPELFRAQLQTPAAVSTARARQALPVGGSVLDVGCGGGAASLSLVPPAAALTGVDAAPAMLGLFRGGCAARRVPGRAVSGRWPEVARAVPEHDVVVAHHVLYNVPDVEDFVLALTGHARRRVVLELTAQHPQAALNELWWHFHRVRRPATPGAADLVAVLREMGLDPGVEAGVRPAIAQPRAALVSFARRRLCLPADAEAEVDRLLPAAHRVPPAEVVCVWWEAR
jgi:SAM-dependent methyltransferase